MLRDGWHVAWVMVVVGCIGCQSEDGAAALVGDACEPAVVPDDGFEPLEAYVEAASESCAGDPCLVYRVAGDPRSGCTGEGCASDEDVQRGVHCSCLCDGPDPNGDHCACPDGFSCVEVLGQGSPDLAGSYCVANR